MTPLARLTAVPDSSGDPPDLTRTRPVRLLLIQDPAAEDELVRSLLEEELPHGEIDVVDSLDPALRHLVEREYDLVLADLTLTHATGEAIVRCVREAFPQLPLAVLTGQADGTVSSWTSADRGQDHRLSGDHRQFCSADVLPRATSPLGLPDDEADLRDLTVGTRTTPESPRQTAQWGVLRDALAHSQVRRAVHGLTRAWTGGLDAALGNAAGATFVARLPVSSRSGESTA